MLGTWESREIFWWSKGYQSQGACARPLGTVVGAAGALQHHWLCCSELPHPGMHHVPMETQMLIYLTCFVLFKFN